MRYVATLQRSDDAHVDVAQGNDRLAVIEAATEIYARLVPEIILQGRKAIAQRATDEIDDARDESFWQDELTYLPQQWASSALAAQEWNVTVYDVEYVDPENLIPQPPEPVFTIGATLDGTRIR